MGFITVSLLGLVLATVLWMIVKRLTSKKLRLPPAPEESLPLLGHLFTFLQRPEVESIDDFYLNRLRDKLGDVYMLNLAGTFAYIVSNQELAKTILTHPNTQNRTSNKSHKRAFGPRARGRYAYWSSIIVIHSVSPCRLFSMFQLLIDALILLACLLTVHATSMISSPKLVSSPLFHDRILWFSFFRDMLQLKLSSSCVG